MSSYIKNNYADVFLANVRAFQPVVCVELGVLNGYSTIAIAQGLKELGRGRLDAYDLFEDYEFRHGSRDEVYRRIVEAGVGDHVELNKTDAFMVHHNYRAGEVHLLHVDLSNTGEILARIMETWDEKMVQGGIILFEGGSQERDEVEWIRKYNKTPIKPELEKNKIIEEKYVFGTYLPFPSLTVLLKKR
jgi:hypothetical protein